MVKILESSPVQPWAIFGEFREWSFNSHQGPQTCSLWREVDSCADHVGPTCGWPCPPQVDEHCWNAMKELRFLNWEMFWEKIAPLGFLIPSITENCWETLLSGCVMFASSSAPTPVSLGCAEAGRWGPGQREYGFWLHRSNPAQCFRQASDLLLWALVSWLVKG